VGERAENVRHGATWCRDDWQIQTGALDKKITNGDLSAAYKTY
jgi:hypothetical protein